MELAEDVIGEPTAERESRVHTLDVPATPRDGFSSAQPGNDAGQEPTAAGSARPVDEAALPDRRSSSDGADDEERPRSADEDNSRDATAPGPGQPSLNQALATGDGDEDLRAPEAAHPSPSADAADAVDTSDNTSKIAIAAPPRDSRARASEEHVSIEMDEVGHGLSSGSTVADAGSSTAARRPGLAEPDGTECESDF